MMIADQCRRRTAAVRATGAIVAALLLQLCTAARASAEETAPISLAEAIGRALDRNPAIDAGRQRVDAAEAGITRASFGPTTNLQLDIENFAGSGAYDGTDALETTLQLSRALELGGKLERRVDVARAGRDAAVASLDTARLDLAAEVTRRFVDVLGARATLGTARRFLDLSQGILQQAERRVTAGNALSAEVHRARAEVGRERLFVARAEADLETAGRTLAASWGDREAVTAVSGQLFAAATLEPLETYVARIEQGPRLAELVSQERLRETERRLAEAEAAPDLLLAFGARRLNEPGDSALVGSVSIPLGTRARSRASVAESEALARSAAAGTRAGRLAAVTAAARLHRAADLRRRSLGVLADEIIPAASAAREQVERGYRLGRLSYGEYAIAAREALESELERVRVAAEYHQLVADLEGLTGTAINTGNDGPPAGPSATATESAP